MKIKRRRILWKVDHTGTVFGYTELTNCLIAAIDFYPKRCPKMPGKGQYTLRTFFDRRVDFRAYQTLAAAKSAANKYHQKYIDKVLAELLNHTQF